MNVPRKEIYRYMGYKGATPDDRTVALVEDCLNELLAVPAWEVTSCVTAVETDMDTVRLLRGRGTGAQNADDNEKIVLAEFESRTLSSHLKGCDRAMILAATIGPAPDELTDRYTESGEITKAYVMQACGSAAVEELCDEFTAGLDIPGGFSLRTRYSPGYGDFPLQAQKELLELLPEPGIVLTDTLMMIPSKSVTALIGICADPDSTACSENGSNKSENGSNKNGTSAGYSDPGAKCRCCSKTDCDFRL